MEQNNLDHRQLLLTTILFVFGCDGSEQSSETSETGAAADATTVDTSGTPTGGEVGTNATESGANDETAGDPVRAQIERGVGLYTEHCSACHGNGGQGVADGGPAVVGEAVFPRFSPPGSQRAVEFVTALDVFTWTLSAMPANAPGSLPPAELLDIFAFALDANAIALARPLDAALAEQIVINPDDPQAVAQQIAAGVQSYAARCSQCHGAAGEGVESVGPPLVGSEAFPRWPRPGSSRSVEFVTAADVFTWAAEFMPGDAPGDLSSEEWLQIFAFDLDANGVMLSYPLTVDQARHIVLNPDQ